MFLLQNLFDAMTEYLKKLSVFVNAFTQIIRK